MSNNVLVVEDDDMVREMIDVIMSQAGYVVSTAASGEAALGLLRRMRFQLVVLDVHMPHMSGLEVLTLMKRLGRSVPPVLMVTANRSADTVEQALDLGCAGYLAKPFTPETLVARARKAIAWRPGVRDNAVVI